MTVDGFSDYGNSHYRDRPHAVCRCGNTTTPSPRLHHFWSCPAAISLRTFIANCAQLPVSGITRRHLWLAEPPPGVMQPVWDVVVLAALSALARCRRRKFSTEQPGTSAMSNGPPGLGNGAWNVMRQHGVEAVADFAARVASFVALGKPREGSGWSAVGAEHPFVGRHRDGRLCTRMGAVAVDSVGDLGQ